MSNSFDFEQFKAKAKISIILICIFRNNQGQEKFLKSANRGTPETVKNG